jgi:hypothetical protein
VRTRVQEEFDSLFFSEAFDEKHQNLISGGELLAPTHEHGCSALVDSLLRLSGSVREVASGNFVDAIQQGHYWSCRDAMWSSALYVSHYRNRVPLPFNT